MLPEPVSDGLPPQAARERTIVPASIIAKIVLAFFILLTIPFCCAEGQNLRNSKGALRTANQMLIDDTRYMKTFLSQSKWAL